MLAVADLDTLEEQVSKIFDQAQKSTASHQKNAVMLLKLQQSSAEVVEKKGSAGVKLSGEKAFGDAFLDMFNRLTDVKKSTAHAAADRVVKFIGLYMRVLAEKASELQDETDDDDDFSGRFLSRVLKFYLRGFVAKNKAVRYRTLSIVSEMILYLGELDEETYIELRSNLVDRLQDREPAVRAQAVVALSKLVLSEDPSEVPEDEVTIMESLLNSLCGDASPEVRRASLVHIPLTASTIDALTSRARDCDAVTRKLLYSSTLTNLEHPRLLSIAQRELIVRRGLNDREDAVRVAAGKLIHRWFEQENRNATQFLSLFDVTGSDVAVNALVSLLEVQSQILNEFQFDDEYWAELSAEQAVLARVLVEHCLVTNKDLERYHIPVVTAFAFHIQTLYNSILELRQQDAAAQDDIDGEEQDRLAEQIEIREFALSEMLKLATSLDYADEIGRRKMFAVVRNIISHGVLPEVLIASSIDLLRVLTQDERDFIRVVVEAINDLRDVLEQEANLTRAGDISIASDSTVRARRQSRQPRQEMTPQEQAEADAIDMKCLILCIAMLERVTSTLEENSTLDGILNDVIVPAVKRKELSFRENGLVALGLCCLITKSMALNSFQLFASQLQSPQEGIKTRVLRIIFDVIMVHEREFFGEPQEAGGQVIELLLHTLETDESPKVQATLCVGFAKLLLSGLVSDSRILSSLLITYVSPVTKGNEELRQCLSYFFPVFSYSSTRNRSLLSDVFISAYDIIAEMFRDLDDEGDMITPLQFCQVLADWLDPQKRHEPAREAEDETQQSEEGHLELALRLLRELYESERSDEDRKAFVQVLPNLYLPVDARTETVWSLNILLSDLPQQCPLEDLAVIRVFDRFVTRFRTTYATCLEDFDEATCRESESYRPLYEFTGSTAAVAKVASGRKQPANPAPSQASDDAASEDEVAAALDDEPSDIGTPPPPPKSKAKTSGKTPKRKAKQKAVSPIDSPGEDVPMSPITSTPKRVRGSKRLRSPAQAASPVHKKKRPQPRKAATSTDPFTDSTNKVQPGRPARVTRAR